MLRTVLWIAAACAAVLLALAASRMMNFGDTPPAPIEVVEPASAPEPEAEPEPVATPEPKPTLTPDELQIQEDAAATGMTTIAPDSQPSTPPTTTAPPT